MIIATGETRGKVCQNASPSCRDGMNHSQPCNGIILNPCLPIAKTMIIPNRATGSSSIPCPSNRQNHDSPQDIPRVVINPVPLQNGQKLRLKIPLPMMLLLPRNVRHGCIHL